MPPMPPGLALVLLLAATEPPLAALPVAVSSLHAASRIAMATQERELMTTSIPLGGQGSNGASALQTPLLLGFLR